MEITWYWYAGFILFVVAMLLVDLKFFHAEEHDPTPKESTTWVAVWVSLALVFGVIVFFWKGPTAAGEYFAGYLIEYSLSVDNMFVFVLIFSYFKVEMRRQHQVLFYGILGAMIFRGIFIAVGVVLIERFDWIIYVFGAFLVYTAIRIARGTEEVHPEHNPILRFAQKKVRSTTRYDGQKLFTRVNAKRYATPLFAVLVLVAYGPVTKKGEWYRPRPREAGRALANGAVGGPTSDEFTIPGSESQAAFDLLEDRYRR